MTAPSKDTETPIYVFGVNTTSTRWSMTTRRW